MINTNSPKFQEMKDKEYRDLDIASQAKNGIAFQIRALRAARGLKQDELAKLAETKQTAISRIENRGAGYPNVGTLLKLAKVFDVALVVRFEPIDRYLDWIDNLSPADMAPLESAKILEAMEGKTASELQAASSPNKEIPFHSLRLVPPSTTAAVQGTLVFSEPYVIFSNELNSQTPASQHIIADATKSSDASLQYEEATA